MSELVAQQEAIVAQEADNSAFPADILQYDLAVPTNIVGKTVLDIASGCSDFVWWLSERGATAYGVDIGYRDPEALIQKAMGFLLVKQESALCMLGTELSDTSRDLRQRTLQVIGRFRVDIDEHPERYMPDSAADLSFDDETFDHAFNHSFFTSTAGLHMEFLTQCISEALRVLKPRGSLHISPLQTTSVLDDRKHPKFQIIKTNLEKVIEDARQRRIVSKLARLSMPFGGWIYVVIKSR